ncbi:MAG: hypothetical protein M3O91_09725 [Chloroflexota bacterium]|nr:hypothetical protein [Chloroflexota bacterium]
MTEDAVWNEIHTWAIDFGLHRAGDHDRKGQGKVDHFAIAVLRSNVIAAMKVPVEPSAAWTNPWRPGVRAG